MTTRKRLRRIVEEVYHIPYYGGAEKRFEGYLNEIRMFLNEQRFPNEKSYLIECERIADLVNDIGSFMFDEDEGKHHNKVQLAMWHLARRILAENPKIFVVHGRNVDVRNAVTSVLGKLKLDFEVLEDRNNSGATVVEKFLECAEECDFAIVLMTADDEGGLKGETQRSPRARQNVILELGFFIKHVGRKKIIIMHEDGIHIDSPTDLSGIVHIHYDRSGGWKRSVLKDMEAAGIYIHPPYARTV